MIFNLPVETMSRDELQRLQDERLTAVVQRAAERIPHYRSALQQVDVSVDRVGLVELSRLPFTTKADLRENWPFGMLAVARSELVEIHASSGTTGQTTLAAYTSGDLEIWGEVMARTLALGGLQPGDVAHNAYGYGLFTGGLGFHYGALKLGVTIVPVSSGNTARQLTLLAQFGSTALFSTPSYAMHLAEALSEQRHVLQPLQLRYGLFGAEPWSEGMRRQLEYRLAVRAVDCYGLSEIIGPGVAAECSEAQDGLHVAEDHFLIELLHPDTGEPVPVGTPGELVITTLTREATPLIRYRTGDISSFKAGDCVCGRSSMRIGRLQGRVDDMLVVRGVNVFPSQIEAVLFQIPELEPQYQLVVDRQRALDVLEVEVEARRPAPTGAAITELARSIAGRLRDELALSVRVRIVDRHSIPRSEGKALRVIDRRLI